MISYITGQTVTSPSTTVTEYLGPEAAGGASWSTTEAGRSMVVPHAMTLDQLYVTIGTAPGGVTTRQFTLMVNGVASTLTTTITGAATSNSDLANSVSLNGGDLISIRQIPTGTPAASGSVYWSIRETATNLYAVMGFNSGTPTASTVFLPIQGRAATRTTAALGNQIVPTAGVVSNLRIQGRSAPGVGNTWAFTLFVNGVASALTASVTGATATASDLSHTVSVAAGDLLTWQLIVSGTPASNAISYAMSFDPTTDGESFMAYSGGAGLLPSVSAVRYQTNSESGDSYNTAESVVVEKPGPLTIKALYAEAASTPGVSKSYALVERVAGASSTATVTLSDASTTVGTTRVANITGLSIAVSQSANVNMMITPTGTPNSVALKWSILTYVAPAAVTKSLVHGGRSRRNTLIRM